MCSFPLHPYETMHELARYETFLQAATHSCSRGPRSTPFGPWPAFARLSLRPLYVASAAWDTMVHIFSAVDGG